MKYNSSYPTLQDLKNKSKKRIPRFSFDYLEGTCSDEKHINNNQNDLQKIKFTQNFIRPAISKPNLKTSFCGINYDLPFGIAPVGYQGVIWPNMSKILSKTAKKYNIPYVLSTFATNSIEEISEVSEGTALFQLYNPQDKDIRKDIITRVKNSGYRALIVTIDITSQAYRSREFKNGLLPPRINFKNTFDVITHPNWALSMLFKEGIPTFKTLKPYIESTGVTDLTELRSTKMKGSVDFEYLKSIRDMWNGPLIIKGVLSEHDMEKCIEMGADGVIISNHGGRMLDNTESTISVLPKLSEKYGDKIHINFDSGIESGTDIASVLASGAEFAFAGRAFCYGVSALGENGASHTIEMLAKQLTQVLCQIGCDDIKKLPDFLVK